METKITNWHAIEREAKNTLGEPEFNRRVEIARGKAREIANDPTWLHEETDREEVFKFMAWRLQSIAVQLGNEMFARFETRTYDDLACIVIQWITEGKII